MPGRDVIVILYSGVTIILDRTLIVVINTNLKVQTPSSFGSTLQHNLEPLSTELSYI